MPELILDATSEIRSSPVTPTQFTVRLADVEGFTPLERAKLNLAVDLWALVWNSEEFRRQVCSFRWAKTVRTGGLFRRRVVVYGANTFRWNDLPDAKGLSNEDVLHSLISGAELTDPVVDHEADIFITIDRDLARGVKGYTYRGKPRQWIGGHFFTKSDPADIAGNLAHEYCHRRGYGHESRRTPLREFTVPYAIGYLTARMAEEIYRKP